MADRWKPTFAIQASLVLHVAAVIAVIARPHLWPWVLGVIIVDHLILTAAGLWPRSKLLGPNWTHLPATAAANGSVAITIDDGPDPAVTPQVLDLLDQHSRQGDIFLHRRARRAAFFSGAVKLSGAGTRLKITVNITCIDSR